MFSPKSSLIRKILFLAFVSGFLFLGKQALATNCSSVTGWKSGNFNCDVTYGDLGGSKLVNCFYRVESNGVQTFPGSGWASVGYCQGSDSQAFTIYISVGDALNCRNEGASECTLFAKAIDSAGNEEVSQVGTFDIDYNAPVAGVNGAPANYVNTNQTAVVTCQESAGSYCDATSYKYQVFSSSPGTTCPTTGYTAGSSVSVTSNSWVCSYVKDFSGKEDYSSPVRFKIDKDPPNAPVRSPASRDWSSADISVTVSYDDDLSGVQYTRHCWTTEVSCDPGTTNADSFVNGGSISQTTEGAWTLCTRARDAAGNWRDTDCSSQGAYKKKLPPAAPSGLSGIAVCGGPNDPDIDLAWSDNSTNEAGFKIYRGTSSGFIPSDATNLISTLATNIAFYQDTSPLAGTTYWYKIKAYNEGGSSSYAASSAVTSKACVPSFVLEPSSATISDGGTKQFDGKYDSDGDGNASAVLVSRSSINWSSLNTSIATVDNSGGTPGLARAVDPGTVTIRGKYDPDGVGGVSELTSDASLTVTNNAPSLNWTGETSYTSDGLNPETGTSGTNFVYRIKYTDADNDAPNFVRVRIKKGGTEISGNPFDMTYVSGTYSGGAIYSFSKAGLVTSSNYTYYFEARDSKGADAANTIEKDAPDIDNPPAASISVTPSEINVIGQPNAVLSINVSGSSDDIGIAQVRFSSDDSQNGSPEGGWTGWYNWAGSSGDWNATSKIKDWGFATCGAKEVWVEIKDGAIQTAQSSANNTVNCSPISNAGSDKTVIRAQSTTLNGSGSDSDGTISSYGWSCTGGTLSNSSVAAPTYTAPTVTVDTAYTCTLTVTDNDSAFHSDNVTVNVKANASPVISSVSASPDSVSPHAVDWIGPNINFSADWSDPDTGDQTKLHICKTNAISGQTCSGGSWCNTTAWSQTSPAACSYTTALADQGTKNYYAFVCDDDDFCSPSVSGTFLVDTEKPKITAFSVVPTTLNIANPETTISWTVSDTGGAHLWYANVFRRTGETGSWAPIKKVDAPADSDGPWTSSYADSPSDGTYYYGVHVIDEAGNDSSEGDWGFPVIRVTVDKTQPNSQIQSPASDSWQKAGFKLDTLDEDLQSGLKAGQCQYKAIPYEDTNNDGTADTERTSSGWQTRTCNALPNTPQTNISVGSSGYCKYQARGACYVQTRSQDEFGNWHTPSLDAGSIRPYNIDWTKPQPRKLYITSTESGQTYPIQVKEGLTYTYKVEAPDNLKLAGCSLVIDNIDQGVMPISPAGCSTNCSASKDFTFTGSGTFHNNYALCRDAAGNIYPETVAERDEIRVDIAVEANHAPQIISAPSYTTSPCSVPTTQPGCSIKFSVSATDSDGDSLSYFWNFGDGGQYLNTTDSLFIAQYVSGSRATFPVCPPWSLAGSPPNPPCGSYGDVDGDSQVTNTDANWIAEYLAGSRTLTPEQKRRGDINGPFVTTVQNPSYNYLLADTYSTVVSVSDNRGGIASNSVSVPVADPTLSVALTADPDSGVYPLNDVDLEANVSGTMYGDINYKFSCSLNSYQAGANQGGSLYSRAACDTDINTIDCPSSFAASVEDEPVVYDWFKEDAPIYRYDFTSNVSGHSSPRASCDLYPGIKDCLSTFPSQSSDPTVAYDWYQESTYKYGGSYAQWGRSYPRASCDISSTLADCPATFSASASDPAIVYDWYTVWGWGLQKVYFKQTVLADFSQKFTRQTTHSYTSKSLQYDKTDIPNWDLEVPSQAATTYSAPNLCDYPLAGIYNAKVYVERGTGNANNSATVNVSSNSPPVAGISVDYSLCGPGAGAGTAYTKCIFKLNNVSTDPNGLSDIKTSTWTIKEKSTGNVKDNSTCLAGSPLCGWSLLSIIPAGTYVAQLDVEDMFGQKSVATREFTVKQDIMADFVCSLDNVNWKRCDDSKFRPAKGGKVYFNDNLPDSTLSGIGLPGRKSLKSDGSTEITNRTWKKNGVIFSPGATNNPNPSSILQGTIVELTVEDDVGRTDSQSYDVQTQLPIPEWQEISPF